MVKYLLGIYFLYIYNILMHNCNYQLSNYNFTLHLSMKCRVEWFKVDTVRAHLASTFIVGRCNI